VGDAGRLRPAVAQIPALPLDRASLYRLGMRGSERDLDLLGPALPDQQPVVLADVLDDRLVHLVARDPDRVAIHRAAHRDDGHLGRAASDVDDQVAARLVNRQAPTDGRGPPPPYSLHPARAGPQRRRAPRAVVALRDARRDADYHARPVEGPGPLASGRDLPRALDEILQHPLGDVEVGDDAILQRAQRLDVLGGAAEHRLGL